MKKILICGPCAEDRIDGASYFGGAGGGIALNLANRATPVGLLSVLGKDAFSKAYEKEFFRLKIDTAMLFYATHIPVMTLLTKGNTEKARRYDPYDARDLFATIHPSTSFLKQYDFLHVVNTPKELAGYLADNFPGTISYCPGSLLVRDPKSLSQNLLRKAAYLFCNEEEYAILQSLVDIQSLLRGVLEYVFLTKGKKGTDIIKKEHIQHLPTISVRKIMDTTGAGDALVVGFINGIFHQQSIEESIQGGQALAAAIIQKQGVIL